MRGFPGPHFSPSGSQTIAHAEDGNEAGKGTAPRSLEEPLEELRQFGLEKTQGDSDSLLRPLKVQGERTGAGGRQSSTQHKKTTFRHCMDESNCLETLCCQVLKIGEQELPKYLVRRPKLQEENWTKCPLKALLPQLCWPPASGVSWEKA